MAIVVGEDSYITVQQASQLLNDYFMNDDPLVLKWEELAHNTDDRYREKLLKNVHRKYDEDSFFYKGRKQVATQKLQFPRVDNFGNVIQCPEDIKIGLLIMGLRELINADSEELKIKELGVKSFKDGSGASVEFGSDKELKNSTTSKNEFGIYRDIWRQYFSKYTLLI